MKIKGLEFINEDHVVGPWPIERTVKCMVESKDDDGKVITEPVDTGTVDEETGEPVYEDEPVMVEGTETIIFGIYAQPIWSYKPFDKLMPMPEPNSSQSVFTRKGKDAKKKEAAKKDPQYLQDLDVYYAAREGWTLLKSLEPSGIELEYEVGRNDDGEPITEAVTLETPNNWNLVIPLLQAMFSHFEYNKIVELIDRACGIDAAKLAENRESFLSSRRQGNPTPTKQTNS